MERKRKTVEKIGVEEKRIIKKRKAKKFWI